jgi:hypothetical protein
VSELGEKFFFGETRVEIARYDGTLCRGVISEIAGVRNYGGNGPQGVTVYLVAYDDGRTERAEAKQIRRLSVLELMAEEVARGER